MRNKTDDIESGAELVKPPFLYEIRVKGRLSGEQWAEWFDDLSVTHARGESILRGRAPDHAALYGLLARLRDLAVPLVGVKVLDAEAQRSMRRRGRRYDIMITALLVSTYLALLGGLIAITVFVAPVINTALALSLLFAALGGLAQGFGLWAEQAPWRWVALSFWLISAITFLVFIPVSGIMPTPMALAVVLFILAGGLIYLIYYLRGRHEDVREHFIAADADDTVVWDDAGRAAGPDRDKSSAD
jgi:hypothetical protein